MTDTQTTTAQDIGLSASSVRQVGVVKSDKRDKTRSVVISWKTPHPKYGKYVSKRKVLQVHDEANESNTGDLVEIAECRPVSKTKAWKLVRVIEKRSAVFEGNTGPAPR